MFLRVPKCEVFVPFFLTPINLIWVGDLRTGIVFVVLRLRQMLFAHAECALKNCLSMLSMHYKFAYAR
jgi:hypothetical protein